MSLRDTILPALVACVLCGCPTKAPDDNSGTKALNELLEQGKQIDRLKNANLEIIELEPKSGELKDQLEAVAARAKERKLRLYVEVTADWCEPCKAIEKHLADDRMIDAFEGVYLVQLDAMKWNLKQLGTMGVATGLLPTFFELGPDGRATGRKINGGAWKENVPENMAPVLKRFFKPDE